MIVKTVERYKARQTFQPHQTLQYDMLVFRVKNQTLKATWSCQVIFLFPARFGPLPMFLQTSNFISLCWSSVLAFRSKPFNGSQLLSCNSSSSPYNTKCKQLSKIAIKIQKLIVQKSNGYYYITEIWFKSKDGVFFLFAASFPLWILSCWFKSNIGLEFCKGTASFAPRILTFWFKSKIGADFCNGPSIPL